MHMLIILKENSNEKANKFFKEKPKNHWYPVAGIGISYLK